MNKKKVTATTRSKIQVEYLEARVNYGDWVFEIRNKNGVTVNPEDIFEIEVFNKVFGSGSVFLHKDCYGNELVIPTMESALNQVEAFIYNELK